MSFVAGNFLSYFRMPLVMIIIPTLFFLLVMFLPDTPLSLIKRNKLEEAKKSLLFYRSSRKVDNQLPEPVRLEFETLKRSLETQDAKQELKLSDFSEFFFGKKNNPGISIYFKFQLTPKLEMVCSSDSF